MAFADTLKRLRLSKGLTQEELANGTGLAKSSISMYESGRRKPSFEVLEAFADFFNVDMNTLWETRPVEQSPTPASDELPELTRRDERQIAKDLEDMLHSLKGSAAMGELEDEEDMELLKASLSQAMTLSKRIAKKKFTPKKHRK